MAYSERESLRFMETSAPEAMNVHNTFQRLELKFTILNEQEGS